MTYSSHIIRTGFSNEESLLLFEEETRKEMGSPIYGILLKWYIFEKNTNKFSEYSASQK